MVAHDLASTHAAAGKPGKPGEPGAPGASSPSRLMTDEESLAAAIHEDVALHAHDPAWMRVFEQERDRLQSLLPGTFLAIEHIGSTAVAGLVAKPIVDLLAAVESLDDVDALIDRLCENGYTTSREFNATISDRKWLMRWRDGHRTHHLHLVVADSSPWRDRLAFRDALRGDPALAQRYAALKSELATTHRDDREAYTDAKAAFVRAVVQGDREADIDSGPGPGPGAGAGTGTGTGTDQG